MILIPVAAGIAAVGAGAVCFRGVTTESGVGPGGDWRVRWACWRWLAEKRTGPVPGKVQKWEPIGAYKMGQQGFAKAAAILSVAQPLTVGPGNTGMVRITRRMANQ